MRPSPFFSVTRLGNCVTYVISLKTFTVTLLVDLNPLF